MKRAQLALPLAVVLVGAIGFVAVWSPQSKRMARQQSALVAAQSKLLADRAEVASLRAHKAGLVDAQAKLAALKLAIPVGTVQDQVIDQLNALAVVSGVDLQSVAISRSSSPAGAGAGASTALVLGIPMGISGSYPQIIDFVNRLNAMTRLVVVDGLTVTSVGPVFSVQVAARTFYANSG